jgi:hypothetical protein
MGLQLWHHYLKNTELFDKNFFSFFLKLALQDKSLNSDSKKKLLLDNGYKAKQYLSIHQEYFPMVQKIYPNNDILPEHLEQLGIRERDWKQYNEDIQNYDYLTSKINDSLKKYNLISDDCQDITNINNYSSLESTYYDHDDINQYFFKCSAKSPCLIRLDTEITLWPYSYVNIFQCHFQPLLHQIGVKDVIVGQNNEYEWLYNPDEISEVRAYNCNVYVACAEIIFEFRASVADKSNDQSSLIHYLNMVLQIKGKKERFVNTEIWSDSYIIIALYDPERLNDFLKEYRGLF